MKAEIKEMILAGLGCMLVFFAYLWYQNYKKGTQPDPQFSHEIPTQNDSTTNQPTYSPSGSTASQDSSANTTDQPQNLVLHLMASLQCPGLRSHTRDVTRPTRVVLPESAIWMDALDYDEMRFATPRPTDSLVPDGFRRGEMREHGFVGDGGLGRGFGAERGDMVSYAFELARPISDAAIAFRYRATANGTTVAVQGLGLEGLRFDESADLALLATPVGDMAAGCHRLQIISQGGGPLELDGFAILASGELGSLRFEDGQWQVRPEILSGHHEASILLKYADVASTYGLAWTHQAFEVREFYGDELAALMRQTVHHHTRSAFFGQGDGHFTNVFMRPISVDPRSTRVIHGLVCAGQREEVESWLGAFQADPSSWEATYQRSRASVVSMAANPPGRKYAFSQERMAATMLTNVVYPVYAKRQYIRHNTPGRWWDSLYTWDSGFVGLGLAQLDVSRAIDCLNAYMTEPGDEQAAFIHHGSPVPTQFYLFQELWNRTQSRELLTHFYPRLRQYHRFMAGRLGSSTTATLKSGLLKTWDYFYNSGGWDDYPPQVHVHKNGLEATVAPAATTSHVIRCAKILRMAAIELGVADDLAGYDQDVKTLSDALQRHAWDAGAGYFGYVVHDASGEASEVLRHDSGANYNMGMDGASPLIADICSQEQRDRLIAHLMSPVEMWTSIGLSTVDRSAPYYRVDGYWNGAVWMPHQWFFWKALLGRGRTPLARRIARTGLEVWKNEVDASYNCFEHFIVQSGRGAGWHQFGGLSAPVLCWYMAYHRPGTLTVGLDAWIKRAAWSSDRATLDARIALHGRGDSRTALIAVMSPHQEYVVTWRDEPAIPETPYPGVLEIPLPTSRGEGDLRIAPRGRISSQYSQRRER